MKRLLMLPLLCAAVPLAQAADLRLLRDPFARPVAPVPAAVAAEAVPPAPLHLRAVILHGAGSLANIDGDIVAAGEQARDYKVLRIDARGVLVTRAGKEQLLTLTEKDKQ